MKTKKITFLLLAVAFTVSAFATKTPKMNIVALEDSKAIVMAVTDPETSSELSIISKAGDIVYFKKNKGANGFRTVFDFSALKDGVYTIKVKTGEVSSKSEIEVNNGEVNAKPAKTEYEPYFLYDRKLLKLSYLNFDRKNISMLVYNGNELVFEVSLGNDFNIQRAFDVSKLADGNFDFVLAGNSEAYDFKVTR